MPGSVKAVMRRYGVEMTLLHDAQQSKIVCFFQPVRSKSRQHMVYSDSPFGVTSQGQYVFLGDSSCEAAEGDLLEKDGRRFRFRRIEPFYCGKDVLYVWGLYIEEGVDDRWNSLS